MAVDLAHWYGNDLSAAASGDLLTVGEPTLTEQRLVRRLLTVLGSYFWELKYGAGLSAYVGKTASTKTIKAIVLAQLKRERSIQQTPNAPQVTVTSNPDGTFVVTIQYWNNLVSASRQVKFPVIGA